MEKVSRHRRLEESSSSQIWLLTRATSTSAWSVSVWQYAEQCYTDDDFQKLRQKYVHARPFTKESLLYREIFEKYYPGQSGMVLDFWMPNREWEGCDVDDPSARVLANYGQSGV